MRPLHAGLVVNWGFSGPLFIRHDARIVNNPTAVAVACSKLSTFRQLNAKEVPCLTFSEDSNVAQTWLEDGSSVVCRDILNGKSGAGIRIINRNEWNREGRQPPAWGDCRLFTRYFKHQREVRLHVTKDGNVLASAIKLKRRGEPADYWVRSHNNGWIFADYPNPTVAEVSYAVESVKALGLDFGAVDLGSNADGDSRVFEVNTAPGLEGRTLEAYVNYLRGLE